MKKSSRPVITGIITAVVLLVAFASCGNLNSGKNSSIIVQLNAARSSLQYQKSDVSYHIVTISPDPNGEGEVRFDRTKTSHAFEGLPSGKYTITVKAYNESNILVAEGSDEDIEVIPGETATAVVEMEAKTYHVHEFATEWTTDAAYHWHAATCGDTEEVQDRAEHTFGEWITVIPATEENEGQKKRTCTVCNYEETETIPLLNHTHVWMEGWSYDAEGHYHNCTGVNCSEIDEKIPHTWDAGDVTTQPTCTAEGVMTYTCTVCHATKTEAIPATGEHVWDAGVTTQPTCTEDGVKTFTCTDCHATKTEVIPAQGHVWGNYVYDEESATEEHAGTKTAHCENCEATDVLPANGRYTLSDEFSFTETIQPVPGVYSGSMESANKTGTYVIFGDFPQKVAPINFDINPHAEKNGYYIGEDGYYYEKVLENAYYNDSEYSDNTPANQIGEDSYRYFKVEPIIWRVVTKTYDIDGSRGNATGALLCAENGLIAHVYNDSTRDRTINSQTIKASNYEYSTIRAYLNGLDYLDYINDSLVTITTYRDSNFLTKAFTPNAVEIINDTTIANSEENGGNETTDKLFLLGKKELSNSSYGFSTSIDVTEDSARIRKHTDYSLASRHNSDGWWTRYAINASDYQITSLGHTGSATTVSSDYYAVVPALTVPVSALPQ